MTKKILICDDEESVRESLKLILSDSYELILVDSEEQVLETLKHHAEIGLLMMDIKMPLVNGVDILNSVKEFTTGLPVVMITGYKSVETAREAEALGAVGSIVKPFKSDEILNTTKKFLKK